MHHLLSLTSGGTSALSQQVVPHQSLALGWGQQLRGEVTSLPEPAQGRSKQVLQGLKRPGEKMTPTSAVSLSVWSASRMAVLS